MNHPRQLFFENAAGRLQHDARGFLRLVWHPGVADRVARQEIMEQVLEWLRQHDSGKVLVDQRYMMPFSPAEQQWISESWTPRAVQEGGYRHRAILAARDVVARLASAAVVTPVRDQINYCFFDNETEAVAWLLAQK